MSRPSCHLKDKKLPLCIRINCHELVEEVGRKDGQEVVHREEDHVNSGDVLRGGGRH